jgi:hypothetical protein
MRVTCRRKRTCPPSKHLLKSLDQRKRRWRSSLRTNFRPLRAPWAIRPGPHGSEIKFLLTSNKMVDPGPLTKRTRIYNAFADSQNSKQNRAHVLQFIRLAVRPARYNRTPERFEPLRAILNQALAFAEPIVDEAGSLESAETARTLPEAQRRVRQLRADLEGRGTDPDLLKFCRAEKHVRRLNERR